MTAQVHVNPKEIMAQDLRMVRRYAEGTALPNKQDRMREIFAIGQAYGLTEKELDRLVWGTFSNLERRVPARPASSEGPDDTPYPREIEGFT